MLRLHLSTKQVEMCITNILFNFVNVNVKGLRHICFNIKKIIVKHAQEDLVYINRKCLFKASFVRDDLC